MKKREFRCYFEGQQEKMYFDYVAKKIKEFDQNISEKFKEVGKLKILEKSSTDVPKIAVFDYDLNRIEFENRVRLCKKTKILYSNLNFDLWIVLHKEKFTRKVQDNHAYVNKIREIYKLPENANIKSKDNIKRILEQIELDDIKKAIRYANEIMSGKLESDRIYVRRGFSYFPNPSMSINEFFYDLFKDLAI